MRNFSSTSGRNRLLGFLAVLRWTYLYKSCAAETLAWANLTLGSTAKSNLIEGPAESLRLMRAMDAVCADVHAWVIWARGFNDILPGKVLVLAFNIAFLQKPFSPTTLAAKICEVIEA